MTSAVLLTLLLQAQPAMPAVTEGDFVIKDFKFNSGESLPELRMHYRTIGAPRRNAQGVVTNAVKILRPSSASFESSGQELTWLVA